MIIEIDDIKRPQGGGAENSRRVGRCFSCRQLLVFAEKNLKRRISAKGDLHENQN